MRTGARGARQSDTRLVMDPLTAFTNLATALVKYATVVAEGQPQDVREQMWRWFVKDIGWWRKKLGIDDESPS